MGSRWTYHPLFPEKVDDTSDSRGTCHQLFAEKVDRASQWIPVGRIIHFLRK